MRAGARCPVTVSRVPSLRAWSLFGHALSSTSQPRNAFYLPSKEPLFLQVSHFKELVEGCNNLLCGVQCEYGLNFWECSFLQWIKSISRPRDILLLSRKFNLNFRVTKVSCEVNFMLFSLWIVFIYFLTWRHWTSPGILSMVLSGWAWFNPGALTDQCERGAGCVLQRRPRKKPVSVKLISTDLSVIRDPLQLTI